MKEKLLHETKFMRIIKGGKRSYKINLTPEFNKLKDNFDYEDYSDEMKNKYNEKEIKKFFYEQIFSDCEYDPIKYIWDLIRRNNHKIFDKYNESYIDKIFLMFLGPITNAIDHGNNYDNNKSVWLDYSLKSDRLIFPKYHLLTIKIKDEGNGFDHKHLIDSEKKTRGTKKSYNTCRENYPLNSNGFGLFENIRFCDSVEWNEIGNEIILKKKLKKVSSKP